MQFRTLEDLKIPFDKIQAYAAVLFLADFIEGNLADRNLGPIEDFLNSYEPEKYHNVISTSLLRMTFRMRDRLPDETWYKCRDRVKSYFNTLDVDTNYQLRGLL